MTNENENHYHCDSSTSGTDPLDKTVAACHTYSMNKETDMTTRTYYVGDLCYVMNTDEWHTVCMLDEFYPTTDPDDFDPQGYLDPENTSWEDELAGRPFYLLKTAFGDGCYLGSDGKHYSVDSGTIGCIAVDDIVEQEKLRDALEKGLGHLHEFEDFTYGCVGYDSDDNSILYFGDLDIPT